MKKIKISEGHGPGKEWNRGGLLFNEGDENFVFGGLINNELKKYDVDVKALRHEKGNQNWDNEKIRAPYGADADLYYSSHSNADYQGSPATGVEVILSYQSLDYYDFAKGLSDLIANTLNIRNRGVKFRNLATDKFETKEQANKTKKNWYAELRGNKAKCAILVEHFFHTNMSDSKKYLAKRSELAKKIAAYIAKYFNLTLKENTNINQVKNNTDQLYRVQVGAFNNKENADKLVKELENKGFKPFISTSKETPQRKTNEEIAKEVLEGKWGNNPERKKRLEEAGYKYLDIQTIVNRLA